MKKVLYIHQYFRTPEEGGALRSFYIAKGLVERGHQVDMITSHNGPDLLVTSVEGINVHYLTVYYDNKLPPKSRYITFLKFAVKAIKYSGKLNKPDIAYVTSTPLTVGIVALWLKWIKNVPYIFEVRDLWPEAPIQLGIMKPGFIQRVAFWLEKTIYKNAAHLVALSPGIREGILATWRNTEVSVIPNMADIGFYIKNSAFSHKNKDLVIGYFGAMGIANGLMTVVAVAEICLEQNLPIKFVLMGEGSEREKLNQALIDKKLSNVELLHQRDKDEVANIMNRVDACIVSFLKFPVLETCSPNKFFDALAAGKLCIVNTNGWLRNLVEENRCGFYFDPDEPGVFPSLIQPFLSDRQLLEEYQQNALNLGESHFSKDALVNSACDVVDRIIKKCQ